MEKGLLRGRKLLRDTDSGFHVAGVPQSQSTLWDDALSCGHHLISWDDGTTYTRCGRAALNTEGSTTYSAEK